MLVRAGALGISCARGRADALALSGAGGSFSFGELDRSASRIATGLAALGVQVGERVAMLTHNRSEAVAIWLGLERAGLVRVVLHSHFEMAAHVRMLRATGASVLLFDERFADALAAHRGELRDVRMFAAIGSSAPAWACCVDDICERGVDEFAGVDVEEDAPVCVQPTTGTTGEPKPWVVSHRGWRTLVAHNLAHLDALGPAPLCAEDVNLHVHALQWASGAQTLLPYMLRGASSVLLDDSAFDPRAVVAEIRRSHVTGLLLPGPMLDPVLDVVAAQPDFEHRLRRLVTLFAPRELLERTTELLGPVWCHGYGATEQGAPVTRLAAADAGAEPARLESVGRAASTLIEVDVVDSAGAALPPGTVGEIVVRSAMSSSFYWNEPALTDEAYMPGDWFRSRDLGYMDEDGFLFYVDRARDEILTAGGAVYPHAVEVAVLRHGAVGNVGAAILERAGPRAVLTDGGRASLDSWLVLEHTDDEPLAGAPRGPLAEVPCGRTLHLYPRAVLGDELFAIPISYGNWQAAVALNRRLYRSERYGPGWEESSEVMLTVQGLLHGTGLLGSFPFLSMGLAQVVAERFDPGRLASAVHEHRVTSTGMTSGMLAMLLESIGGDASELASLRRLMYGGGHLAPAQMSRAVSLLGPILVQVYGRLEGGWPLSILDQHDHEEIVGGRASLARSCGRPVEEGVAVELRPVDGHAGDTGELCTRSAMVVSSYADPDGWCRLGDLARLDADGYLYLEGRLDDMINTGFHVYPGQVEQALRSLPGVRDARVIGEPHPKRGQILVAYVAGAEDAPGLTDGALREALGTRLAAYKIPRRFHVVSELPAPPGETPRTEVAG